MNGSVGLGLTPCSGGVRHDDHGRDTLALVVLRLDRVQHHADEGLHHRAHAAAAVVVLPWNITVRLGAICT